MLEKYASELDRWLKRDALPLWWQNGADFERGGFVETIGLDGKPTEAARRGRVQPRQVYCYALAGRLGWQGPWEAALKHGLTYFQEKFWLESGYYANTVAASGALLDDSFDLYNQAFALFGFAQAAQAVPAWRPELEARSLMLLERLQQDYAHWYAGFENDDGKSLPLKSNPHMHLFEAAMSWADLTDPLSSAWAGLADEIAGLAMTRFIDAKTGALREFFDAEWNNYPGVEGQIVEPGHQFEWSWLLTRWGQSRGNAEAIVKAERLFEIGMKYGICESRHVAVMQLLDDFTIHDDTARLWPQTEWLKSSLRLAKVNVGIKRDYYQVAAQHACEAMMRFLEVPTPGLWRDKMVPDGSFVTEAAPASSFYHIACAIDELCQSAEMPAAAMPPDDHS
ncbi:MAG TPA: AGE family epimerase/isomerase [Devosia sp.]|nr:AGE family epimerase/isomerase [Devosia sp.]